MMLLSRFVVVTDMGMAMAGMAIAATITAGIAAAETGSTGTDQGGRRNFMLRTTTRRQLA